MTKKKIQPKITFPGFSPVIALAIVIAFALFAGGAFFFYNTFTELDDNNTAGLTIKSNKNTNTATNNTYINADLGISFEYPNQAVVRKYTNGTAVRIIANTDPDKNGPRYTDAVGPGPIGVVLYDTYQGDLSAFASSQAGGNLEPTTTTVAGETAYRITGMLGVGKHRVKGATSATIDYYYFNHNGKTWGLEYDSANVTAVPSHDDFTQLVASFQFTDETADWKTYTNADLRISFSYPPAWGEVTAKAIDSSMSVQETGSKIFSGKAIQINFTQAASISFIGSSSDFNQFKQLKYNGGENLALGCENEGVLNDTATNICRRTTIDGQQTYDAFVAWGDECSFWNLREVRLNLTAGDYVGLLLSASLPSSQECLGSEDQNESARRNDLRNLYDRTNLTAETENNLNYIDQLLSTFQFTDETADWLTYTNTEHHFSLRYPADMTYANITGADGVSFSATDHSKAFKINFIAGPLDPNNIIGIYGKQATTTVTVGTQSGYQYREGDAGCGGDMIQTALSTDKIMKLYFGECDNTTNAFYSDASLRTQLLSTFQFTE
ncbi:MAG: hypothetical protein PHI73_02250 [Patescibacteria group bacterium]|nr:hypothetical protein [Patescibacteria group bacterium]